MVGYERRGQTVEGTCVVPWLVLDGPQHLIHSLFDQGQVPAWWGRRGNASINLRGYPWNPRNSGYAYRNIASGQGVEVGVCIATGSELEGTLEGVVVVGKE